MEKSLTKYPVVLVHGMVVKDFKYFRTFGRIRKILKKNNVKTYVTNQDGVGAIETNAQQIKKEILNILKKENVDKVNIIAHSKGGVDSRYMIHELGMENHVASLTTLSTPHHGSKLSSKLLSIPDPFRKVIAFFINLFFRICRDKKPNIIRLGQQLTSESMEEFNKIITNSEKVYYQSYSSNVDDNNSFLMFIPYTILEYCEEDYTDGLVSVNSAKWGEYQGDIGGAYDHVEMIGVYGSKKKMHRVAKFYMSIINGLSEKGF